MLDLLDFQADKGGDIAKIKESQRRRYESPSTVDDVLLLFEDHKRSPTPSSLHKSNRRLT